MPSNDYTYCLSPACSARQDCWRHWSHHPQTGNARQSYTTFDGSVGRDCVHFLPLSQEHRAAPSQPGIFDPEN